MRTSREEKPTMYDVILERFEQPDEVRNLEKGKFELVSIGGMIIGRATYEPGWREESYVSLHLMGAATYAANKPANS